MVDLDGSGGGPYLSVFISSGSDDASARSAAVHGGVALLPGFASSSPDSSKLWWVEGGGGERLRKEGFDIYRNLSRRC